MVDVLCMKYKSYFEASEIKLLFKNRVPIFRTALTFFAKPGDVDCAYRAQHLAGEDRTGCSVLSLVS